MKLLGYLIPPWVWAALAAVALVGAFSSGWQVRSWKCAAAQKEALEQAQKRLEQQLAKQQDEAERYERNREQARVEYRDREGAIRTIYRDAPPNPDCGAPDGVRSVLDDAIRSANRSAGQPGEPVSGAS